MLHFLLAFTADLVILARDAVFSMALMTSMANVCLMSCTAKQPGGGRKEEERVKFLERVIEGKAPWPRSEVLSLPGLSSHQSLAHLELGTQRRSPHTWPRWGPSALWLHQGLGAAFQLLA